MSASIVFLHGLESGPRGNKARHFAARYGALAVDLDTRAAVASFQAAVAEGAPWDHRRADLRAACARPLERARAAIGPQTRLLIGSSFGGALVMMLMRSGDWQGPALILAGAGLKLTGDPRLPEGARAVLIHGRGDAVVPLEDARATAAASGPGVCLWEVDDDHRLDATLRGGLIDLAVAWLTGASPSPSSPPTAVGR